MADDVRQALEEYAATTLYGHSDHKLEKYAPRAFDALRQALDYADDLERLAYDKWMAPYPPGQLEQRGHYVGVMETERQASLGIRAAILSALTDSPDMAMEDR